MTNTPSSKFPEIKRKNYRKEYFELPNGTTFSFLDDAEKHMQRLEDYEIKKNLVTDMFSHPFEEFFEDTRVLIKSEEVLDYFNRLLKSRNLNLCSLENKPLALGDWVVIQKSMCSGDYYAEGDDVALWTLERILWELSHVVNNINMVTVDGKF